MKKDYKKVIFVSIFYIFIYIGLTLFIPEEELYRYSIGTAVLAGSLISGMIGIFVFIYRKRDVLGYDKIADISISVCILSFTLVIISLFRIYSELNYLKK